MDPSILKAFHGYQSSFIPFSSAYYLYLCRWDSTPTSFSSFSNIWVVTPEDNRILFADPLDSRDIPCIYHDFHEVYGASITLDWASENHLLVQCASDTGDQELNFELAVRETLSSRLIAALAPSRPTRFTVSRTMIALANFLMNLLVTKGGTTMSGMTETGQPFYVGASERLMLIERGSATVNGMDLGDVSSPTWPVEFGDFVPCVQPVIRLGTLYIPYEEDTLEG